ncbi:hypothetical protein G845_04564 [Escherichia coli HVH 193 (4-3331423)]|nr:hypothetical protein G845_04564 [Escherichia coli HVH 193 (4-3331423)]
MFKRYIAPCKAGGWRLALYDMNGCNLMGKSLAVKCG